MLSGHVNKYLNERGTFDTAVCQYTFGLTKPSEDQVVVSQVDYMGTREVDSPGLKVKFPQRQGRQNSLADQATTITREIAGPYYGTDNEGDTTTSALPQTRGFGLGGLPMMDATAESAGFAYSSGGKSNTYKSRRESVPITQGGKTPFGNKEREAFSLDKLKIATAQPMSRFQLQ